MKVKNQNDMYLHLKELARKYAVNSCAYSVYHALNDIKGNSVSDTRASELEVRMDESKMDYDNLMELCELEEAERAEIVAIVNDVDNNIICKAMRLYMEDINHV